LHAFTTGELREALRPIASLIGKSRKSLRKLSVGTWQHTMLRDNLAALSVASALMNGEPNDRSRLGRDDFRKARVALASMIGRAEKGRSGFRPGTPQHSLQQNRIKALRIAEALMVVALGNCVSDDLGPGVW
jgi:hypothetical protein